MELPNNTHSSEAAKQMKSVAEGFNPELTTEEKIRAAAEFEGLVLSTFLRFAGDAKTYDHTVLEDGIKSSILLEIPQEDGSCVLVNTFYHFSQFLQAFYFLHSIDICYN